MDNEIYSVKLDYVFKKVFQTTDILGKMYSELVNDEDDIVETRILNNELLASTKDGKTVRFDIFSKMSRSTGEVEYVDFEMQRLNHSGIVERFQYYAYRMVSEMIYDKGIRYRDLSKFVSVIFTDFALYKGCPWHEKIVSVYESNGEKVSDLLEIHIFNLRAMPDTEEAKEWYKLFNAESTQSLEELMAGYNEAIKKAAKIVEDLNRSKRDRLIARAEKDKLEEEALIIMDSVDKGKEEERSKTIKSVSGLINSGNLDLDTAVKAFAFTPEEIAELKELIK